MIISEAFYNVKFCQKIIVKCHYKLTVTMTALKSVAIFNAHLICHQTTCKSSRDNLSPLAKKAHSLACVFSQFFALKKSKKIHIDIEAHALMSVKSQTIG